MVVLWRVHYISEKGRDKMLDKIVDMFTQSRSALPARFHSVCLDYFCQKVEVIFCPNSCPLSVLVVVYWDFGEGDIWERVIRFIQFNSETVSSGVICLEEDIDDFMRLPKEMRKAILREIGYHYYSSYVC